MSALTTTEHVGVAVGGAVLGTLALGTVGAVLMPVAVPLGLGAIIATAVGVPGIGAALGGWAGWALGKPAVNTVQQLAALPNPPIVGHV